jgi:hypothetical protein
MATTLNGNDTNRLVEVLVGSTALLNDTNGGSALPLSFTALFSDGHRVRRCRGERRRANSDR